MQANTKTYRGNSQVLIGIGILKSYEHMGIAEMSCVSGCECEPLLMDGQWESKTSQSEWQYASGPLLFSCLIESSAAGAHAAKSA